MWPRPSHSSHALPSPWHAVALPLLPFNAFRPSDAEEANGGVKMSTEIFETCPAMGCAQYAGSLCAVCRQPVHSLSAALPRVRAAENVDRIFRNLSCHGLRAACRQSVRSVCAACRQGVRRVLAACAQLARSALILSTVRLANLVVPWRVRSMQAECAKDAGSVRAMCAQRAGSVDSEASETCPAVACAQPARSMRAACRQPGLGFFQMSTDFFKPCQTPFLLKFPRTISSP